MLSQVSLSGKGEVFGTGLKNYYQFLMSNSEKKENQKSKLPKETETADVFTHAQVGMGRFSKISCGHKHSWYVNQNRTKIFSTGFNGYGNCGIPSSKSEIFDKFELVYDIEIDFNRSENELIEEIHSGFNFNLIRTTNRVLFFGNNLHQQMPKEFGKTWGLDFLYNNELDFKSYDPELSVADIRKIVCKYDRTAIIFNNGRAFIYGGMFDKHTQMPFIDSWKELPNFSVLDIGFGVNYELIHGYKTA